MVKWFSLALRGRQEKLLKLRENLLQMTEKIDQRIKEKLDQAKTDLEKIIGLIKPLSEVEAEQLLIKVSALKNE